MLLQISKSEPKQTQGTPETGVPSRSVENGDVELINSDEKLHKVIGKLEQGVTKHWWSRGTFNSVRLLFCLANQIGSCDIFISTYSISEKSVRQLWTAQQKGKIRNIRFLIDHRVRAQSPKPFQALYGFFPGMVRTTSIHAKVTTLQSDDWKVSIVSSMNATDNNKIERGLISTDPAVFDFDNQVLNEEFERGAT